jgi:RNA polymerase sigma factor (sigma-70 family)
MKEYTDEEIIECLRERKSYVVSYLSGMYMPMIRRMVYGMGGTLDDAKDIFQDGLMIILEKIDDKDFVFTCKLKTFLYCICENLWKKILVKRQSATIYLTRRIEIDRDKNLAELLDNKLYKTIFWDVFNSLDKVGKKILKLYWQEMVPSDIADILGYTYSYVRKKKCITQKKLIEMVKKHPDYIRVMKSADVAMSIVY